MLCDYGNGESGKANSEKRSLEDGKRGKKRKEEYRELFKCFKQTGKSKCHQSLKRSR